MRRWHVHKVHGNVRIVNIDAELCVINQGGALIFYNNWGSPQPHIVAAYPAHAWRYCEEMEQGQTP